MIYTGRQLKGVAKILKRCVVNPDNGCWEYQGPLQNGYAYVRLNSNGKTVGSVREYGHRLMLGQPEKLALHRCNNRKCVNPRHLYEGDYSDNHRDTRAAGNHFGGKKGVRPSKFTEAQVRSVYHDWQFSDLTRTEIAKKNEMSVYGMECILRGHTWKHIWPGKMERQNPSPRKQSRKLSPGNIADIHRMASEGVPVKEIADCFKIHIVYAYSVLRRKK